MADRVTSCCRCSRGSAIIRGPSLLLHGLNPGAYNVVADVLHTHRFDGALTLILPHPCWLVWLIGFAD